MEIDVQQLPRRRNIIIDVTDREWNRIKIGSLNLDLKVSELTKNLLLKMADKYSVAPPDKEDSELSL